MAPSAREWAETLELGHRGEEILDAVFGPEFIIVKATAHHQRQGIDRFLINRKDGRQIMRVDYKHDQAAGRTGNLALEHVSVVRKGQHRAAGSIHTTIAELIISYVPALESAFILEVGALRLAWPDIMRLFPPRIAATGGAAPYQSLGVLCPDRVAPRARARRPDREGDAGPASPRAYGQANLHRMRRSSPKGVTPDGPRNPQSRDGRPDPGRRPVWKGG